MSNRDLKVTLLLLAKDNMSGVLVRALKNVKDNGNQAETSLTKVAESANKAKPTALEQLARTAKNVEQSGLQADSSLKKLAGSASQAKPSALEQVARTTKNVDQSGKQAASSLDKLASAANKPRTSALDKLAISLKNVRSVAAGTLDTLNGIARAGMQVAAGGYMAAAAAKRPMDYGRQLASLSNTAYSDLDSPGRIAAQQGLHEAIKKAVKDYGGSPETGVAAFSSLAGSGAFGDAKSSMNHLPGVLQAGTAADADREQLIQILNSAKQSMHLDDDKAVFSKAIKGGQLGGFELKDMSRYLPEQMAKMSGLGMDNQAGYESLIAANQAVRIVSGTPESAANNLINLLDKAASHDTIKAFEKQDINLTGSLAKARAAGANTLEAFVHAVEDVAGKDKHLKQALLKIKKAKSEDRKQALEGAADIFQQSAFGQVINDRQAMMGLLGMIDQRDKYNQVKQAVAAENGQELERSFATVAATSSFKSERVSNDVAFAGIEALQNSKGPLDKLLEKAHDLTSSHEGLAAAAYSASTVLGAIGAMGITGVLFGAAKKVIGAGAEGAAGTTIAAAATDAGGSVLLSVAKKLAGPTALLAAADYVAPNSDVMQPSQKAPPYLLDAMMQGIKFSGVGLDVQELMAYLRRESGKQVEGMRQLAESMRVLGQRPIDVVVTLDGQQIAASVNTNNAQQARRN